MSPENLVIFSDHHAHDFPYGSRRVPYGAGTVNSRLYASHLVIKEVADYAEKHNVSEVVFLGDLFHKRAVFSTDVYNLTVDALRYMTLKGIKLHMIPGNHDYANRDGTSHSLQALQYIDGIEVYSDPKVVKGHFGGRSAYFIPYIEKKDDFLAALRANDEKYDYLFAHQGIQGAKVGADFVLRNSNDIEAGDFSDLGHGKCFFGHFHQHQQVAPNAWYVGATHQHVWSDANTERGFIHLVDGEVRFVETHSAPRFHVIGEGESTERVRPGDFVRIIGDVTYDIEHAAVVETVSTPVTPQDAPKSTLDDFSAPTYIREWAASQGASEALIELGLSIYERTKNG